MNLDHPKITRRYIVPGAAIAALAVSTSHAYDCLIAAGEAQAADATERRDQLLSVALQAMHVQLDAMHETLLAVITEQPETPNPPMEGTDGSA